MDCTCSNCDTIKTVRIVGSIPMDHVAGVYYRKMMNESEQVTPQQSLQTCVDAFSYISNILSPLRFEQTQDETIASFKIYFGKNGDDIMPRPFSEESLGFALPAGEKGFEEYRGNVYINDEQPLGVIEEGEIRSIYKIVLHEIWHAIFLSHTDDENDIMYYRYQFGGPETLTQRLIEYIQEGYQEKIVTCRTQLYVASVFNRYESQIRALSSSKIRKLLDYFNMPYTNSMTQTELGSLLFQYI